MKNRDKGLGIRGDSGKGNDVRCLRDSRLARLLDLELNEDLSVGVGLLDGDEVAGSEGCGQEEGVSVARHAAMSSPYLQSRW